MLKFRLTEHNDFVDKFILVESTHTFAGNPKPLYYLENKDMFAEFHDKIVHVIVDDMPQDEAPDTNWSLAWRRDFHQRRAIDRGIKQCQPDDKDILLIGDCDEIFHHEVVKPLRDVNQSFGFTVKMTNYYYDLQHKCNVPHDSPRILTYDNYKVLHSDPEFIRRAYIFPVVENGGWHLSYFGDEKFIQNKLSNFAHQEYNNQQDLDLQRIKDCIENYTDVCKRGDFKMELVPLDQNTFLPRHYKMLLNADKWSK